MVKLDRRVVGLLTLLFLAGTNLQPVRTSPEPKSYSTAQSLDCERYICLYRAIIPPQQKLADLISTPDCAIYGSTPQWLSPSLGILQNESAIFVHILGTIAGLIPSTLNTLVRDPNGTLVHSGDCPLHTDTKGNFDGVLPLWTLGSPAQPARLIPQK
jgi:hypothetical protein